MSRTPDPAATARLSVDLDALSANYRILAAMSPGAEVAPVVKADGYGLGAIEIATHLWAEGVRTFFTARVAAGVALRQALGPDRPCVIYVLDGCPQGAAPALAAADLVPCIASLDQLEAWRAQAAGGPRLKAALHVDTGLNRLGLSPRALADLAAHPARLSGVEVDLIMSHLVCGTEAKHRRNPVQAAGFRALAELFPDVRASLSASGGIFLGERYRFDMVRPGVSLYGVGPEDKADERLATVATFEAEILQVRDLAPGDSVGYGADWVAERPSTVAIIGAGYADGLLRSLYPGGGAWFDGAVRPFVGRLSMDLSAIDVTGAATARAGEWVELFGRNLPVEDAARSAGTVAYELLAGTGSRIRRRYVGG